MKDVENFLKQFDLSKTVAEVFGCDCCYWFAAVLFGRFIREGATIVYDKTKNHFGTRIRDKVYDITGDVTAKYQWVPWESITDSLLRARVVRERIMF